MSAPSVELDDIQGLVRFGYKRHTEACFLLLRVKSRDTARAWLAQAPVASAATQTPPPPTVLQLAFTSAGLRALGVPGAIVEAFAPEFVAGMSGNPSREQRLGDVGPNEPARWLWGSGPWVPHVLLMLYALPGRLAEFQRDIEAQCDAGFEVMASLPTTEMGETEPFGFVDGISQPQPDWERLRVPHDQELQAYTNLACLGEFVLGYPNEYGGYTDRPLLDPLREAAELPRAEDLTDKADLGRNGSYLVMRQLRQDVHAFWQTLDRAAGGDAAQRQRLAEAMVGRTMKGEPLVEATEPGIEGSGSGAAAAMNAFTYRSDPQGLRCPLGAHVRRANPRNADLPPGGPGLLSWLKRTLGLDATALVRDRIASTRFHRLLRRGREYGAAVPLEQALHGHSGVLDQGLHFICLNANIARQFEFVQAAWMAGTHFDGLSGESDPLLGHRQPGPDGQPTDAFSIPQPDAPDRRLQGLPPFVSVRGGAYFFLPGIRALRFLAAVR